MIKQYKTNLNCGNCVNKVRPLLDAIEGIRWEVDTQTPDKILSVEGDLIDDNLIIEAVEAIGFDIEPC